MYYIEDTQSQMISFSKVEISLAACLFGCGREMVVQAKGKWLGWNGEKREICLLIICADLCYEAQTVSSLSGS